VQGQAVPQYYFHRPIWALFNVFFEEGFVIVGMEEPAFGQHADKAKIFDMVFQKYHLQSWFE